MRLVHVIELHNVDTTYVTSPCPKGEILPFVLVLFTIYSLLPSHTKLYKRMLTLLRAFGACGPKDQTVPKKLPFK